MGVGYCETQGTQWRGISSLILSMCKEKHKVPAVNKQGLGVDSRDVTE